MSRQGDDPMPKQRTRPEQRAYEERMKRLKLLLELEALPPERTLTLSEEEKDCRLSNLDLKILRRIIQCKE
jgi:hypothetical protein